jgi:pimeloyl-ACP methyl ester carboxylesterase
MNGEPLAFTIPGTADKPITVDVRFADTVAPLIIFVHGFKGFKDWGHFNRIADELCRNGFTVLKFNFSHNGTTPEHLQDFADLDAFGNNNFSTELDELGRVMDWVFFSTIFPREKCDLGSLFLLGHSRGGGIVLLKAAEDARVKKLVTWAAVSDFESRVNPENLEAWKTRGVIFTHNARTKQDMPLYYQFREDFYRNRERLDIAARIQQLQQPLLLIHGSNDESVLPAEAEQLHKGCPPSILRIIDGANHTFGGKHPYTETALPAHTLRAVEETVAFLK